MQRQKIEGSSNISEIGYDPDSLTLEIKFHSGGIYKYFPISLNKFNRLMGAKSKGSYFTEHIKDMPHIKCVKLDGEIQS